MAGKSGAARKSEGQKQQQSGNLGQKEAQQEKRSESELARMGELSRSKNEQKKEDK